MPQLKFAKCQVHRDHQAEQSRYICLGPSCRGRRILCELCLSLPDHMGHQIALISIFVDPFSRLSGRSALTNAASRSKQVLKRIIRLQTAVHEAKEKVMKNFEQLQDRLLLPLRSIHDSYNIQTVYHAAAMIATRNQNDVERVVQKLQRLGRPQPSEEDLDRFENLLFESLDVLNNHTNNVKGLLRQFPSSYQIRRNENREYRLCRQMKQDLQKKYGLISAMIPEKSPTPESSEDTESQIETPEESPISEEDVSPEVLQKEGVSSIQSMSGFSRKQRIPIPVQDEDEEDEEEQEIVRQPRESMIKQKDSKNWTIDWECPLEDLPFTVWGTIQNLTVKNCPRMKVELIETIRMLKKLQNLSIFQKELCTEEIIPRIMSVLSPSVRRVHFNCDNRFSFKMLAQKNQDLQIIDYFYDVINHLATMDKEQFIPTSIGELRKRPEQGEAPDILAKALPLLKSAWLPADYSGEQVRFGSLQHLVVGEIFDYPTDAAKNFMDDRLFDNLALANQLRSLTLLGLSIDCEYLMKWVDVNPGLQVLYLEGCVGLTQEGLEALSSYRQIRQLSVRKCSGVTGKFVEQLHQLQTLIFRPDEDEDLPPERIQLGNFSNLKNLSLFGTNLDDQSLRTLSNCSNSLRYLNIGRTKIQTPIKALSALKELETLVLDQNRVNEVNLTEIFKAMPGLVSLSLSGFDGREGRPLMGLLQLGRWVQWLPRLKNLSVLKCKWRDSLISSWGKEKLLTVSISQESDEKVKGELKKICQKVIIVPFAERL